MITAYYDLVYHHDSISDQIYIETKSTGFKTEHSQTYRIAAGIDRRSLIPRISYFHSERKIGSETRKIISCPEITPDSDIPLLIQIFVWGWARNFDEEDFLLVNPLPGIHYYQRLAYGPSHLYMNGDVIEKSMTRRKDRPANNHQWWDASNEYTILDEGVTSGGRWESTQHEYIAREIYEEYNGS